VTTMSFAGRRPMVISGFVNGMTRGEDSFSLRIRTGMDLA